MEDLANYTLSSCELLIDPASSLCKITYSVVLWASYKALRTLFQYPLMCTAFLSVLVIYLLLRRPTNRIKDISDIGFEHLFTGKRRKDRRNITRGYLQGFSRDSSDLPPVFPNGWIPVLESQMLKPKEVKSLSVFGQSLVVFRGEDGTAFVVDAFCPHLGANLGIGGTVHGDSIKCPFHGWRFEGKEGRCVDVPYSSKVPGFCKLPTWNSCEVNEMIFVWYHAEKEPPSWHVPEIPEIKSGFWEYKGRTQHTVHCHIQEIPENGADVAHLNQLHFDSLLCGNKPWECKKFWRNLFQQTWKATWALGKQEHVIDATLNQRIAFTGIDVPFLNFHVDVTQIGPALVHLDLKTTVGRVLFIHSVTSEGPLKHRVVHRFYARKAFPFILGRIFLVGEGIQFERDVAMWNNKRFLRKPTLMAEDQFILKYRRWYAQFYSENSPTFQDMKDRNLDW